MKCQLQDLIDLEQFQGLQDRLNEIYSFPSAIIDNEGNILTATAWQELCTQFHRKHPECERECRQSDQYILGHLHEANPAVTYRCPHGLVDNATPIIIDGVHYGNFFTGQFFLEPPDLEFFRAQARKFGFDEGAYLEAVKKVPIWTQEQLNSYLLFIKGLIVVLSESGLKRLKEIDARKRAESAEGRARAILETAMDGFWRVDLQGCLLEVNEAYCRMSGYEASELLDRHVSDLEVTETPAETARHMERVISRGGGRFETKHRRKDGSVFDVEVSVQYRPTDHGEVVVFLRDVTRQKQADAALRQSEAFAREVLDSLTAHIAVLDKDGTILAVNQSWRRFAEENGGVDCARLHEGADYLAACVAGCKSGADDALRGIRSVMARRQQFFALDYACHSDMVQRWFHMTVVPFSGIEGGVVVAHESITERRLAEEALARSRAELKAIYDHAPVMLCVLDAERRVVFVNSAFAAFTGTAEADLEGGRACGVFGCLNALDDPRGCGFGGHCHSCSLRLAIEDTFKTGAGHHEVEYHTTLVDHGTRREVALLGSTALIQTTTQAHLLLCLHDITGRKRMEEALRVSEAHLKEAQRIARLGSWEWDAKADRVTWSKELYELALLSTESPPPTYADHPRFYPADSMRRLDGAVREALQTGKGYAVDLEMIRTDGSTIWVTVRGEVVRGQADEITGLRGTVVDITERKRQEAERELTARLLTLVNLPGDYRERMAGLTDALQGWSGCEAVGIRLRDGDDYPYYESRGFPPAFVELENHLCAYGPDGLILRDGGGNPVLECMCGNILCGRFDPSKPFFTAHGSFWTNSTTALLANTTEADRQARTRNRCHGEGYESVALIPLRAGDQVFGLLQFDDPRPNRFTPELIAHFESVADSLAIALSRRQAEEALATSERRFRDIAEHAQEWIWEVDAGGRYTYASPVVEQILGYAPEEILGKRFYDLFHPEDRAALKAAALAAFAAQQPFRGFVNRNRHKHGQTVWLETSGLPLLDGHGNLCGYRGVDVDITERKQAEVALRESQQRLDLALRSAQMGIWDWDVVHNRMTWDDQMFRLYGVAERPASYGVEIWEQGLHPEDRERVWNACQAALRGEKEYDIGFRVRHRDGTVRHIHANGLVLRAKDGQPVRMLGINYDVSERRQLEERLRQAQKLEAIGQLAGGVAHDFNNILAAILMQLSMLAGDAALSDQQRADLAELVKEAKRGAAITRQLLAFSRRQLMSRSVLDLNALLENHVKMLRCLLGEHVDLTFRGSSAPVWIDADAGMVEQVVMNLCVNARDAMPRGGSLTLTTASVEVDQETAACHDHVHPGRFVCLEVQDTGCGMDEATLQRIFEPFFTTKEVGKGTGLGLATVHGIVAQHQGWVEVDSEVGKGTTFRIYLPAAQPKLEAVPAERVDLRLPGGKETILLVEDERTLRRTMAGFLRQRGYSVIQAENGVEALREWDQHNQRIGLLLADMVMPEGMTGLELADRLRARKPRLGVIIISGYSLELMGQPQRIAGDIVYLAKPCEAGTLASAVRKVLDRTPSS